MLKLYYVPGTCALCPHIVLHEAGISFTTEKVNLKDKTTKSGQDYNAINPKGSVPGLVNGTSHDAVRKLICSELD